MNAELLTDTPGALWQVDAIDEARVDDAPELTRVVVAIDPSVSNNEHSDETGIIVAGVDRRGHAYVLEDLTGKFGPHDWATRAIAAYDRHKADRIIGEANNGGLLIQHTLRTIRPSIPFRAVHASRGKVTRAEPISALYEQRKVHHVGARLASWKIRCARSRRISTARAPDIRLTAWMRWFGRSLSLRSWSGRRAPSRSTSNGDKKGNENASE